MKKAALALVPVALSVPGLVNTAAKGQSYPYLFNYGYASPGNGGMWASYYRNGDQGETQAGYTDIGNGPVDALVWIDCGGVPQGGGGHDWVYLYGVDSISTTVYWDTLPLGQEPPGVTWPDYAPLYCPVSTGLSGIEAIDASGGLGGAVAWVKESLL